MPLVKIEILEGHTKEYKVKLLQTVHEGLMRSLDIQDSDRYQLLYEIAPEYFEHSNKSDNFTLIELTLFPGRDKTVKRTIIKTITQMLNDALGLTPDDVFIVMNEPPLENWGLRGEQASEQKLNYKTRE